MGPNPRPGGLGADQRRRELCIEADLRAPPALQQPPDGLPKGQVLHRSHGGADSVAPVRRSLQFLVFIHSNPGYVHFGRKFGTGIWRARPVAAHGEI